ncbi:hypothetical protein IH980_05735 [Patescibacteria group bacterium]|nr:hypothetical protein [Patescibacteria group bacterium]
MAKRGLSEAQVLDAFNTGEHSISSAGAQMAAKKFSGYEIGLYYVRDGRTGKYVVTAAWKRERR